MHFRDYVQRLGDAQTALEATVAGVKGYLFDGLHEAGDRTWSLDQCLVEIRGGRFSITTRDGTHDLSLVPSADLAHAAAIKTAHEAWRAGKTDHLAKEHEVTFTILGNTAAITQVAYAATIALDTSGSEPTWERLDKGKQVIYTRMAQAIVDSKADTPEDLHNQLRTVFAESKADIKPWSDLTDAEHAEARVFFATVKALRPEPQ